MVYLESYSDFDDPNAMTIFNHKKIFKLVENVIPSSPAPLLTRRSQSRHGSLCLVRMCIRHCWTYWVASPWSPAKPPQSRCSGSLSWKVSPSFSLISRAGLEFVWEATSAVYRQQANLKKTKEDHFHKFIEDETHVQSQKEDIIRLYNELKDPGLGEARKLELVWCVHVE